MAEQGMRSAEPPAAEKETKDRELQALKDAHSAIGKRLDALLRGRRDEDDDDRKRDDARADDRRRDDDDDDRKRDDARADDRRRDDAEEDDDDKKERDDARADDRKRDDARRDDDRKRDDARKDRKDKDFEEWAAEEKDEPEHKEKTDPEPVAADRKRKDDWKRDDTRSDDRRRDDAEKDEEPEHKEETDPEPVAADKRRKDASRSDDDRRRDDTRADSATLQRLTREVESLRRDRMRSDEDIDRLSELQTEWQRIAMSHGEKVSQPMIGEGPTSYDRRHARRYQKYSPRWADKDLSQLEPSVLRDIVAPEIRKDSLAAAYTVSPSDAPMLREIKRKVGPREISEFVGPVGALNGMLTPFRLPRMRARIVPPSQQGMF